MVSDMVVHGLRDLEAAAAHVADEPDRPEESRDHAERRVSRFLFAGEDADLKSALGSAIAAARAGPLDARRIASVAVASIRVDAHRIGDGAKPAHRLDGSPKAFGRDGARRSQPFAEPQKRLFVETGHRRAAELVVDHEPNRIRPDVDDRIRRTLGAPDALGIEIEQPRRGLGGSGCFPDHCALPAQTDHAQRRWL